jgi:small subunit ribosomal protein S4
VFLLEGANGITVNGDVVNIASYHLKPRDKVAVRENQSLNTAISNVLYLIQVMFEWLLGITNLQSARFHAS